MKILLAGDWGSELHEEAVFRALKILGHEVVPFAWCEYFLPRTGLLAPIDRRVRRVQNKYLAGPLLARLNRDLIAAAAREIPDAVLIYRGTHIYPDTLRKIRFVVPKAILVGYNNDDPFAPGQFSRLFRHFLDGVPEYDLTLAYRKHNLDDFRKAGAKRVELLRSWFIPERNHPLKLSPEERSDYDCDVVFVGHYEDDNRVKCLESIVRRGWRLRLFGPGYDWDPVIRKSPELSSLAPVRLVWGEKYNKALCGAKIALCFLSKLNRDSYTRRCFEIPATRTMMLSEYSDDLADLYREGEEAEFFRNGEEMIRKIEHYLVDDARREKIAEGGWKRVHTDGHDVVSRMRELVCQLERMSGSRVGAR